MILNRKRENFFCPSLPIDLAPYICSPRAFLVPHSGRRIELQALRSAFISQEHRRHGHPHPLLNLPPHLHSGSKNDQRSLVPNDQKHQRPTRVKITLILLLVAFFFLPILSMHVYIKLIDEFFQFTSFLFVVSCL